MERASSDSVHVAVAGVGVTSDPKMRLRTVPEGTAANSKLDICGHVHFHHFSLLTQTYSYSIPSRLTLHTRCISEGSKPSLTGA